MRTLFISLIFLVIPASVYALGLGNINLKSDSGQPLEAEIQLLAASSDELDELQVGLADIDSYRWAGIDWSPALENLQIELVRDAGDAGHIRVYSNEALQASHVRFLLEAAWSKGRLFREYTVQLDPSGTVEKPVRSTPEFVPAVDNDVQEVGPVLVARGDYGPVAEAETLWSIAGRYRPDSSVSVQQMMLALMRANPDAFIDNNINHLKKDEILRMPDSVELQVLAAPEAFAEVLIHNELWLEAGGRFIGDVPVQPGSTTTGADAELRLVAAVEDGEDGGGTPGAEPEDSVDEEALVLATEQVEMLSQENTELEDKLSEAETIIEDLRRLVELKDDELAALQSESITASAKPGPDLIARGKLIFDQAAEVFDRAVAAVKDNLKIAAGVLAGILALVIVGVLLLVRKKPDDAEDPDISDEAVADESDFLDEVDFDQVDTEMTEEMPDLEIDMDDGADSPEALAPGLPEDEDPEEDDKVDNKLELAEAYLELDDKDQVRSILNEVLSEGDTRQIEKARQLLEKL